MSRWEAEIKYEEYRDVARWAALRFVRTMPVWNSEAERMSVRLSAIDPIVLINWEQTWPADTRMFPWREIDTHFKRDVDRFEVAIWSDWILCGLASGRA